MTNRIITFIPADRLVKITHSKNVELIPSKIGFSIKIYDIKNDDKGLSIEWEYLIDQEQLND